DWSAAAVLAGSVALIVAMADDGYVRPAGLLLAIAISISAPVEPARLLVWPFLLAMLLRSMKMPSVISLTALAAAALLAGKWAIPIAVVPFVLLLVKREVPSFTPPMIPVALTKIGSLVLPRAVLFDPGIGSDLAASPWSARLVVLLLAGGAVVLRPAIGLFYALTAIAIATVTADRRLSRVPLVLAVFVSAMLALIAWSGAIDAGFPLPLPIWSLALVAAIAVVPAFDPRALVTGAVAATAFFALLATRSDVRRVEVGMEATPAKEASFVLPRNDGTVDLLLSGTNLAGGELGTPVAFIDAVDGRGRGFRRTVRIGDVADWGAFRPSMWFRTENSIPFRPAGEITGSGPRSWIRGTGRVRIKVPEPLRAVSVRIGSDVPSGAAIVIESVEVPSR
ncbi:MAG: hypothetical protein WBX15_19100, partial [Thermoanaerobaculia bacterium]